jgi:NitT/TauT family transport system substrate-binding protein
LLAVAVILVAMPDTPAAKNLKKMRITIPVTSFSFYPIYVAQDMGFFRDEGYDFEIIMTRGDGPDVDALIAGNVQFCSTPPHRALKAYEEGKKLLLIANLMNRVIINGFMNKEVADRIGITENTPLSVKIKKLKGLTLGCTRPGAFTYNLAVHYVKRGGYVPQKDVQIIGCGGSASMIAAVESNKVDIGFVSSPGPEQAVHRGKSIMWVNNLRGDDPEFSEFMFETLYVMPDYAEKNPEIVRGVLRACVRALQFIVEGSDEEHLKIIRKRFSGYEKEPVLEALTNLRAATEPSGVITKRAVEAHINFLREAGLLKTNVPWTAVTTNEFLPK